MEMLVLKNPKSEFALSLSLCFETKESKANIARMEKNTARLKAENEAYKKLGF